MSSGNLSLGCNFSLLIYCVLDVSEVGHDDIVEEKHKSTYLIGIYYLFALHCASSICLLSQHPYELGIPLIGVRKLR